MEVEAAQVSDKMQQAAPVVSQPAEEQLKVLTEAGEGTIDQIISGEQYLTVAGSYQYTVRQYSCINNLQCLPQFYALHSYSILCRYER